jgi:hypothetical protein
MKKLLAVLVVLCFAAPAAAVDWNFYGSARMKTFYISDDFGDGLNDAGTDDSDAELQWSSQGNSRLGARVKAEHVSGRLELALPSSNTHDGDVGARLIYGEWKFSDMGTLRVGKGYTPSSQFISGQVFDSDLGLLGVGTNYGRRPGSIQLMYGGFTVALIEANDSNSDGWSSFAGGDPDRYLPKIEASWGMSLDAFSFNIMGGYQYVEVEDMPPNTEDVDVTSYIIGADVGFNFGPAYIKAAGSYGQNWTNARWSDLAYSRDGSVSGAGQFDGDDDVDDSDNWQAALVLGFKVSDMLSLEAGGGYRVADSDAPGFKKDEAWAIYGQAVIAMAPGVWLIPEVGYFDYMDDYLDDDEGSRFYGGAKWQIDF